jgi:hypothetical protein
MPIEFYSVFLAKIFGWPLEYIENLEMSKIAEIMAVLDGINKANGYNSS